MAIEKGVSLENLKEQLRSKFQIMRKNDSRQKRHETIFNTSMEVKKKRVFKTTRKKKDDKEIPYFH